MEAEEQQNGEGKTSILTYSWLGSCPLYTVLHPPDITDVMIAQSCLEHLESGLNGWSLKAS